MGNFFWNFFLAVYHDVHWLLVDIKLLTAKLHSHYVKEAGVGNFRKVRGGVINFAKVGVGHFTSDSAILILTNYLSPSQYKRVPPWGLQTKSTLVLCSLLPHMFYWPNLDFIAAIKYQKYHVNNIYAGFLCLHHISVLVQFFSECSLLAP